MQNTYYEVRDDKGYLAFQCHDTTRDGWFFTNGKGIHVNWEKTSDYGATRYYDDAGNEIELNTGKTMVCIVEDGDSFLVDNQEFSSRCSEFQVHERTHSQKRGAKQGAVSTDCLKLLPDYLAVNPNISPLPFRQAACIFNANMLYS